MKISQFRGHTPNKGKLWTVIVSGQRILGLTLSVLLLAACGGGKTDDTSSSGGSVSSTGSPSSVGTSVSSVPASSGASSSSSSPGGSDGTAYSDFTNTIDIAEGQSQYESICAECHEGGGFAGPIRLELYPVSEQLHRRIEDTMPVAIGGVSPSDCVGQCAADITAYLDTRRVVVASCDADDPVLYSERGLKLLTSMEYQNSVQDLFPNAIVPAEFLETASDLVIARFPNHFEAAVDSSRGRGFMRNAESIADWAIANDQVGACDSAAACAREFVEDFAFRAYRRPLRTGENADENEVAQYQELFEMAPTPTAGLRWAIVAALTSPNFLYRSELGIPVSEAIDNPLFSATGAGDIHGDLADYEVASPGVTVNGSQFSIMPHNNGETRTRDGEMTRLLWTNGSATRTFDFTSPSILTIRVGGNDYNNQWPIMPVSVAGELISAEVVETPDYGMTTYQYLITGVTGDQEVRIEFTNDAAGGQQDGAPGYDVDLYLGNVTVAPAQLKGGDDTSEQPSSLELADPDAYVLDPYEYASALSYFYTGSTPDMELLRAAAWGTLNTREGVAEQIERLLSTERAEQHIKQFIVTWMRVERMNRANFLRHNDSFTDDVRDAMIEELKAFFWYVFDNDDVPFSEFYTADYTFLNDTLAQFYGIPRGNGTPDANGFVRSETNGRGGVATLGAFLATWAHPDETAPIMRAVAVREQMLCHHVDPPPQTSIDASAREDQTNKVEAMMNSGEMTSRFYYEAITEHPQCATCHEYDINPLGGGMEDFDNVGLPRTHQLDLGGFGNQLAVDYSGTLFGPEIYRDNGSSVSFNGVKELSNILGQTQAVQSCLAEKTFRLATGRPVSNLARDKLTNDRELSAAEVDDYACAQDQLVDVLRTSNQSPKALFRAMGSLDLMRFRR